MPHVLYVSSIYIFASSNEFYFLSIQGNVRYLQLNVQRLHTAILNILLLVSDGLETYQMRIRKSGSALEEWGSFVREYYK